MSDEQVREALSLIREGWWDYEDAATRGNVDPTRDLLKRITPHATAESRAREARRRGIAIRLPPPLDTRYDKDGG